jgi:hypothetical protein
MSLNLLKAIHLLDFPKDSALSNVLGTVWAAKPKIRAGQQQLPVLPPGFIQPSKNSTPFHYSFPTASRRVTCACCLFCVARTFAGVRVSIGDILCLPCPILCLSCSTVMLRHVNIVTAAKLSLVEAFWWNTCVYSSVLRTRLRVRDR